MCGISGVLVHRSSAAGDEELALRRMNETLAHRGPDGTGSRADLPGGCVLGHTRLAIVDLSANAAQPMANEDGSVLLVVNGEIYNHADLRRDLEARGHRFRSRSDSEVILHLYEERGPSFVGLLDGMFALAVWDSARRRLLLARDRLGKKPLYYAETPGRFLFGSSPKAILAHPDAAAEPDIAAIRHFLTFNCAPAPYTLFRGIRKLPAGWSLTVSAGGAPEAGPYWDFTGPPLGAIREEEAAERLRELLAGAARKRMMADVPVGAFLSGGLDSAIVVGLMQPLASAGLRTFALGYDGAGDEDLPYAADVAALHRATHEALVVRPEDLEGALDLFADHMDDPIGAPSALSNLLLANRARAAGVPVVQVGEGADELFFGYAPNRRSLALDRFFWRHYGRLPRPVRAAIRRLLDRPLARAGDPTIELSLDATLRECLRRSAAGEPVHWGFANVFSEGAKRELLREEPEQGSSFGPIAPLFARIAEEGWDLATALTYVDLKVGLAERLLMRVDKANMAFAVEARAPFLDRDVAEFAFRIPLYLKLMHGGKGILRAAYRGRVPSKVAARKKRGFPTPASVFLGERLLPLVEARVRSSGPVRDGMIRPEPLKKLFAEYRGGVSARLYPIWTLFVLGLWYDRWIAPRAAAQEA